MKAISKSVGRRKTIDALSYAKVYVWTGRKYLSAGVKSGLALARLLPTAMH